jgi:hypothetical protein
MTLIIHGLPTANAGAPATICESDTYTLSGSVTNEQSHLWSTSGDGAFDDTSLLAATYTPGAVDISAGNATLTLFAEAISPCGVDASDDMILTIQLSPTADAGSSETICETDTFASNRRISEIKEGDVLSFRNAGAYCFSMASNYNSRYKPAEVLWLNGEAHLIRAHESFKDILRNQIPLPQAVESV